MKTKATQCTLEVGADLRAVLSYSGMGTLNS